ncbi:MAG: 16S rRNA (cytidine(1402)-2'-O)-methyltransferase [Oligoflexia bacterium]|nr:16S rRNA (cytidine(1402)-2'-O)-methyltransferase [Oligoflexia bacterium]
MPGPAAGCLKIISTPIGNLADLSPRAREALETADALLCEDTRQAAKLVNALGISRSMSTLERLDAHTPPARYSNWIERLASGETLGLVTDAGTPGISDPGAILVARARAAGITVEPVPGASAVLALLAASGLELSSFTFRGFFPRKTGDRERELALVAGSPLVSRGGCAVWFESPQRIEDSLAALAKLYPESHVVVAKELTKLHESFFVGSAGEVSAAVAAEIAREGARGEWCFAVAFQAGGAETRDSGGTAWKTALKCMLEAKVPISEASRKIAEAFDQPKKQVYELALQLSGKKSEQGG